MDWAYKKHPAQVVLVHLVCAVMLLVGGRDALDSPSWYMNWAGVIALVAAGLALVSVAWISFSTWKRRRQT